MFLCLKEVNTLLKRYVKNNNYCKKKKEIRKMCICVFTKDKHKQYNNIYLRYSICYKLSKVIV